MSRIGKKPVPIPAGIKVSVAGQTVNVDGPKGKLSMMLRPELTVRVDDATKAIIIDRKDETRLTRSLHGTARSLLTNMVEGCLSGYLRAMEVYGVGYGVQIAGTKLTLTVGKSHPVIFDVPAGLKVEVQVPQARGETEPAKFTIAGVDKQLVGEFAAQVRLSRKPEPYKGKGVRYSGEYVRRKVGKAFAGAGSS